MCSVEQPLILGVHCMQQHGIKKRFTLCAQRRFDGGDVGFGVWPHAEQLYISIWPRINHSLMQMTLVLDYDDDDDDGNGGEGLIHHAAA